MGLCANLQKRLFSDIFSHRLIVLNNLRGGHSQDVNQAKASVAYRGHAYNSGAYLEHYRT